MKADTQYNDFIGTSAADISDHNDLKKFLKSKGVDTNRYEPIGANFYTGYDDFFTASIICRDVEQSTDDKPYVVDLSLAQGIERDEFFKLFKRLSVVFTLKHGDYGQKERDYVDEDVEHDNTEDSDD